MFSKMTISIMFCIFLHPMLIHGDDTTTTTELLTDEARLLETTLATQTPPTSTCLKAVESANKMCNIEHNDKATKIRSDDQERCNAMKELKQCYLNNVEQHCKQNLTETSKEEWWQRFLPNFGNITELENLCCGPTFDVSLCLPPTSKPGKMSKPEPSRASCNIHFIPTVPIAIHQVALILFFTAYLSHGSNVFAGIFLKTR